MILIPWQELASQRRQTDRQIVLYAGHSGLEVQTQSSSPVFFKPDPAPANGFFQVPLPAGIRNGYLRVLSSTIVGIRRSIGQRQQPTSA